MTTASIQDELDAYAKSVAFSSPATLQRLRPGLNDVDIDQFETAHDIVIPASAREIWKWRDGEEEARPRTFVASGRFMPLGEGIAAGTNLLASRRVAHTDPRPGATWIQLVAGMGPGLCVEIQGPACSVVLADPASPVTDFPVVPIAELVRLWTWALRNGAWALSAEGAWSWDFDRYPPLPQGHLL
ncbi:hypothetical protein [Frigoribacterium sp. SL97]|uniref:hypothetical protein n=1 Tax=Frigoribacterium sp. SL97 TaxID=2994664 RepID=UPI00226F0F32|nr:hypothetical protein [Frigoribacterium sp. SL97]WAC50302.1 hypothetical protein OVA02_10405 [Frigoribacterium sp. SL97]